MYNVAMKLITLDIKSEKQTVAEAIAQFLVEIEAYKKGGYKVMKVIHGYGSHGVGGAIKQEFLKTCQHLKNKKVIQDFTCCDHWTDKNIVKKIATDYCPDLLADGELMHLNPGCSIVVI